MSEENKDEKNRLDFLYKAFDDTQNTIRFADTKAGFVLAFWTLVLNVIIRTKDDVYEYWRDLEDKSEQFLLLIFIIVIIFFCLKSVWLAYLTLVPRINPKNQINTDDFDVQGLFFLTKDALKIDGKYLFGNTSNISVKESSKSFHERISKLDNESIEKELVFELQKISLIRYLKTARVGSAIASVIHFLIAIVALFVYLLGAKLFDMIGVNLSPPDINFNLNLFIILSIGHIIADFLFRSEKQAADSWSLLFKQGLIYTLILTVTSYIFVGHFNWIAIFILFVSHVIIDRGILLDWWAKHVKKIDHAENGSIHLTLRVLKQAFHFIVLFVVSCLI